MWSLWNADLYQHHTNDSNLGAFCMRNVFRAKPWNFAAFWSLSTVRSDKADKKQRYTFSHVEKCFRNQKALRICVLSTSHQSSDSLHSSYIRHILHTFEHKSPDHRNCKSYCSHEKSTCIPNDDLQMYCSQWASWKEACLRDFRILKCFRYQTG